MFSRVADIKIFGGREKRMEFELFVDFIGYDKKNGIVMARFKLFGGRKEDLFRTKGQCEERLRNLKRQGLPHDQTLKAIENWPKE